MIPSLVASGLAYVLVRVDKTEYPAIDLRGEVLRVTGLRISGDAGLLPAFDERIKAEGWKTQDMKDGTLMIIPVGHSLGEVTGLNFRIQNGEFGKLDAKIYFMPDKKPKR